MHKGSAHKTKPRHCVCRGFLYNSDMHPKNEKLHQSLESVKPSVVLRNEPKLSEHDIDDDLNKMRTEFIPHIQDFVAEHDLFKNEAEVGIEFAHTGVSSVIAIIDTPAGKWVLKRPRNKRHTVGEGEFFTCGRKLGLLSHK